MNIVTFIIKFFFLGLRLYETFSLQNLLDRATYQNCKNCRHLWATRFALQDRIYSRVKSMMIVATTSGRITYSPHGGHRCPCGGHREYSLSSVPPKPPLPSAGCSDEPRLQPVPSDGVSWASASTGLWRPSLSWGSPTDGDSVLRPVTQLDGGGDWGVGVGMAVGNMAAGSPWPTRSDDARLESSHRCYPHLRRCQRWIGDGGGGARRYWRGKNHPYQPRRNRSRRWLRDPSNGPAIN
jgi:hypothetical protein